MAYVEPSIRPTTVGTVRILTAGHYYQYQVIIKPVPRHPGSLPGLPGASRHHLAQHACASWKTTGSRPPWGPGSGWEVWIDCMEATQFTYFQQVGGVDLDPPSVE